MNSEAAKPRRIILLVVLLLLAARMAVQAQFSGTVNGNGFTITGYFGPGGTVTIPTNIDGVTATGIAADLFEYNFGVTNVIIPATVTNISPGAFSYSFLTAITVVAHNPDYSSTNGVLFNSNQTTLVGYPCGLAGSYTIPDTVTVIDDYAFEGSLDLTNIGIPNSIITIGNYAFDNCVKLTSVTIPASVTNIGNFAFFSSTGMTNTMLTNGIVTIGASAFGFTGLTSVTIPTTVTNIGSGAFSYSPLTAITVVAQNPSYIYPRINNSTC
jgi:hypothetical protein